MEKADKIKVLKMNLQISTVRLEGYFGFLLDSAEAMIRREGIHLVSNPEDDMLTVLYAAYLYRKRDGDLGPMPRSLRFALNNRLFSEKAGAVLTPQPTGPELPDADEPPQAGNTLDISLVSVIYQSNGLEEVPVGETTTPVFAKISSISSQEAVRAGTYGMKAEYKATVPSEDYSGETYADMARVRYNIYRTFSVSGTGETELYLGKKAGTVGE